ncbi:MAG: tRNA adenosine(34) deaminase TadA [Oscillospiraceae bacterium]|jgi:tRNA(adenine34) deaminase|nr:tRNA adenosine(34) deaminase TadA [Oscillospiraceae bacterium]
MKNRDEFFMGKAIELAKISASEMEVPVGAVVVFNDEIISEGRNKREGNKNALYHAEIEAIDLACKKLKNWRLCGCELFVTLEPCPMCAGAIINSRILRLVYGAKDLKSGACGSVVNIFDFKFNHNPHLKGEVLEKECSGVLKDFFKEIRSNCTGTFKNN